MSRRRGEKSGKEDGPAGGGWSSKTLFTPSHDFFIFYKSSAFCKIVIPGKQKLRPAILDEEELAKTGMGAVLNMARCMVGLTCSISSICLICLACSICLICLPRPLCSTSYMVRRKGFLDQEEETKKDMGLKDLICKDYKIDDKSRQGSII